MKGINCYIHFSDKQLLWSDPIYHKQLLWSDPIYLFITSFGRVMPESTLERCGKVVLRLIPQIGRDFLYRHLRIGQKVLCLGHPSLQNVLLWRNADDLLEMVPEPGVLDVITSGQLFQINGLTEMLVDIFRGIFNN